MGSHDISEIFEPVGSFGRFQKILFLLLCFPFTVNWEMVFWSHLFIIHTPHHHCSLPGITDTEITNLLIPKDESTGKFSSCRRYDVNTSVIREFDLKEAEAYISNLQHNSTLNTILCDNGWTFNTNDDITTAASDFLWVCDDVWMKFATQTVFCVGSMLGILVFGYLSDVYGRFPCVLLANIITPIANLSLLICNNFYMYCFIRFVMGVADYSVYIMPFVLVMEYLPSHVRSMANPIAFGVFACLVMTAKPWIYLFIGSWRGIVMFVSTFMLVTGLPALYFLPESASWLLTQGKVEKCLSIIQRIAKSNGKELTKMETEKMKNQLYCISVHTDALPKVSFKTIIKSKTVCLQLVIGVALSMIINIVNDADTRNTENVEISFYMMFSLFSMVMLPSQFLSGFLLSRFGRRAALIVGFGSCSLINALLMFLPSEYLSIYAKSGLMMAFRLFDLLCYTTTITFLTEILPTVVRARGMSVINCVGFLSMGMGPQLIYLANFVPWLPSLVFCIVGLFGALLTSFLPETKDQPLAQTIEDVELRGFSRPCCSRTNNRLPEEN